jgi:hypothetical protein
LRGSATTSFIPRRITACRIIVPKTGCCSVVFDPMISMAADWVATSRMEFDMAPEPYEVARPVTVLECQSRAQWSMLFVPITCLASLFIR